MRCHHQNSALSTQPLDHRDGQCRALDRIGAGAELVQQHERAVIRLF